MFMTDKVAERTASQWRNGRVVQHLGSLDTVEVLGEVMGRSLTYTKISHQAPCSRGKRGSNVCVTGCTRGGIEGRRRKRPVALEKGKRSTAAKA